MEDWFWMARPHMPLGLGPPGRRAAPPRDEAEATKGVTRKTWPLIGGRLCGTAGAAESIAGGLKLVAAVAEERGGRAAWTSSWILVAEMAPVPDLTPESETGLQLAAWTQRRMISGEKTPRSIHL